MEDLSLYNLEVARWRSGDYTLPYDLNVHTRRSFLPTLLGQCMSTVLLSVPFFLAALPAIFLPSPGTLYSRGTENDLAMIIVCDIGFGVCIAPAIFAGDIQLLRKDKNWKEALCFFFLRWCAPLAVLHIMFYFATNRSSDFALHYVMFPFYMALVSIPFIEIGAHWVSTEATIVKSTLSMRWKAKLRSMTRVIIALVLAITSCFIPIVFMVCDTQILSPLAEDATIFSALRVFLNLIARKFSTILIGWGTYAHPNPSWRIMSPAMSYWILGMMNAKTGANSSDWKAVAMFLLVDWIAFGSRVVQATHIPEDNKSPILRLPLWFIRVGSAVVPEHDIPGLTRRDIESAHRLFALHLKDMGTTSTFISFILLFPIMRYFDSTGAMYDAVFPSGFTSLLYIAVCFTNDFVQDVAVHTYTHFFYKKPVSYRPLQSSFFISQVATMLSPVLWMPAILLWLTWYFVPGDDAV